jgi:hypothetical protein
MSSHAQTGSFAALRFHHDGCAPVDAATGEPDPDGGGNPGGGKPGGGGGEGGDGGGGGGGGGTESLIDPRLWHPLTG